MIETAEKAALWRLEQPECQCRNALYGPGGVVLVGVKACVTLETKMALLVIHASAHGIIYTANAQADSHVLTPTDDSLELPLHMHLLPPNDVNAISEGRYKYQKVLFVS